MRGPHRSGRNRGSTFRRGLAALEVVLTLAALVPCSLALVYFTWQILVNYLAHVGAMAGGPLL